LDIWFSVTVLDFWRASKMTENAILFIT